MKIIWEKLFQYIEYIWGNRGKNNTKLADYLLEKLNKTRLDDQKSH